MLNPSGLELDPQTLNIGKPQAFTAVCREGEAVRGCQNLNKENRFRSLHPI